MRELSSAHRGRLMQRRNFIVIAVWLASLGAIVGAHAQSWPTKPIRAIVPLTAGSAVDIVPRIVFEQVSEQLGKPILVENRPGASGTIGARFVAMAAPDGYTLLAHSSAHTIAASTVAKLPYDPVKDFTGVTTLGTLPMVLSIAPSKNIKTLQQLVALGKTREITFGSIGVGSPIYLAMQRLRLSAGFKVLAVQFKGAPEAVTETMTGRIDVYYSPISAALPLIRDGKLLPLVVSSRKRSPSLPNVPTTLEAGYANANYNFWLGVLAPAKTPGPIIDRLNGEIVKALNMPAVQEKLRKIGIEPLSMSPEQFDAFLKEDLATNTALAKAAGLTPH